MSTFQPMLAAALMPPNIPHTDTNIIEAMSRLSYPVLVSTKYDGVRAIKWKDKLISRSLKLIPNKVIQELSKNIPEYFDMEITIEGKRFNDISGLVRNADADITPVFNILDIVDQDLNYEHRLDFISARLQDTYITGVKYIPPVSANSPAELFDTFYWSEQNGQEGICFRLSNSPYKYGRSTLREQYLVKLSRYLTSEAIVIGYEEQMENSNPALRDERGYTKHVSDMNGLVPKNTLGALIVEDIKSNVTFRIGTGFDDKSRRFIWCNRLGYLGKQLTYKFKQCGMLNKPRHPTFVGWREKGM